MKRRFLYLLFSVAFISDALAQDVPVTARFTTDSPSYLVGEPIRLTLVVQAPADAIVTLPEFPAEWPPFEVQSFGEINQTISGDTATYRQTLTLIAWTPGDHAVPDTFIQYQLTLGGELLSILADPTVVSVPSVLVNGDTTLRPLKPPVSLPYLSPWLVLVAVVAVAGGVRLARWFLARRGLLGSLSVRGGAADTAYSPRQRALAQLRNLRARNISPTVVYATVADCLRAYIQSQFNVKALDMTTDELITTLQAQAVLPRPQQRDLNRMLEYADLVKFADIEPGERAVHQLLDTAEKWVEAVEPEAAPNGGVSPE